MTDTKLKKPAFKYIESEWYNYHKTQARIIRLREEIMHPHSEEGLNTAPGYNSARMPGDPTGQLAIRLTTHQKLEHLSQVTDAIRKVYESSPRDYQDLVKLRYWSGRNLTWDEIAEELHVSRRQAIYWRDALVQATADLIGFE
jgi:RinA family phage transcriptional activator